MELSSERVQRGINRLLQAPRDLPRWDRHLGDPGRPRASARHLTLFEEYALELGPAAHLAEETWDGELAWRISHASGGDPRTEQWMEYPAGPAAQPHVIALVRRVWLACDALNRAVPPDQAVAPEVLVLKWLAEVRPPDDLSVQVLSCMPYWPIGLDIDGNWL